MSRFFFSHFLSFFFNDTATTEIYTLSLHDALPICTAFPEWRGNLFVGSPGQERLVRLAIANGRVTGEEHLLIDRSQRVRDVRQGPDGLLYIVTDARGGGGELWRIAPRR